MATYCYELTKIANDDSHVFRKKAVLRADVTVDDLFG